MRASIALTLLAWPTAIALVTNQDAHANMDPFTFALSATWSIGMGCLGLGVTFLRPRDPLAAWERDFRSSAAVQRSLAHTASMCWVLSLAYTATMLGHAYHLPQMASIFTLILFLAPAIWLTVIVLVAPAKTRLETAYRIERENAEQLRAEARAAFDAAPHVASLALEEESGGDPLPAGALDRRHGLRAVARDETPIRRAPWERQAGRDASGQ